MSDIDYMKLLEQEPEFEAYVKNICYRMMLNDSANAADFLRATYGFYQSGIDGDHVTSMINIFNRLQGDKGDEA